MKGYCPEPDPRGTVYKITNDVNKLLEADAILLDNEEDAYSTGDTQEAMEKLRQIYPEIEPGYGYFNKCLTLNWNSILVHREPGLTTDDEIIAAAVCKKYGKIPNYSRITIGTSGFIISGNHIRYCEKTKARRDADKKRKAEAAPKRNFSFLQKIVDRLLKGTPKNDMLLHKIMESPWMVKFDAMFSVHQRNRMLLEIYLLLPHEPTSNTAYEEIKKDWLSSVPDPKLDNPSSLAVIKMLDDHFQVGKE